MKSLAVVFLLLATQVYCQEYGQAAGIRLGHTSGIAFKKFVSDGEAVDLLASGRNEGLQLTALYAWHRPLEVGFEDQLFLYVGAGAHIGYERFDDLRKSIISVDPVVDFVYEEKSYFTMGVDGVIGVEYQILSVPMTVAAEVRPYVNFIGMRFLKERFWDLGISVKYVF